ncbi:MAG: FAD:protein FMN transferase [Sandaracinaceae bacterium]
MSARVSSVLVAIAIALVGCSGSSSNEQELQPVEIPSPPPEPEPPTAPAEPILVQRSRPIMGTVFQVTVLGMPEEQAEPLIYRALDEIDRLETVLSEWRDDSEIGTLNARAGRAAVPLGPDSMAVLEAGLDVSRWSGGAFDVSWAALRGLYSFDPDDPQVPSTREVRDRLRLVGWEQIQLDPDAHTGRLARAGMAVGTGGIAKGYALDRAGAILEHGGADSFMLFGGGQVQVHGMRGDRPWRVGIQHPRDPATYIGFLESSGGSISTSGDYEHAFVDDSGTHWHHIIDLHTGLPSRRSIQVTLLADEGVYADALSTACFILGPPECLRMLAEIPGHHEAVIIDPELRIHTTPGTEERIVWRVERDASGRIPGDPAFVGWERGGPIGGVPAPQ